MPAPERVAAAVPANSSLPAFERRAILEIALLAIAADQQITEEESAAFHAVAKRLDVDAAPLIEQYHGLTREQADAKLLELAEALSTYEARTLAYRAAYAMSLADDEASDEEFEFDLQLVDALELSQEEADRLIGEVATAING